MFTLFLAHELKKTLGEIKRMPKSEFYLWMAYFKYKSELEEQEIRKMKARTPRRR